MKKQSIVAMAMILGLAGSAALPTQAAGKNCISKNVLSNNCIIVNGQVCDVSDVQGAFEKWCEQIQSVGNKDCPVILLPGCNLPGIGVKPDAPESDQPETEKPNAPESNQPETEKPNVPENNQPETPDTDDSGDNGNNIGQPDDDDQSGDNGNQPNVPDTNIPEQDNAGNNQPETPDIDNSGDNVTDNEKPDVEQNPESVSYAEQVVNLVNEERAKAGLPALELDTQISAAALIRAQEIKTSFSHTRPDGRKFSTVLTDNGISFRGAGENIAWGQVSPEQVMNAWMNSDGHRANILNANFTKIGVGHYQDANGRHHWAQLFTY